MTACSNNATRDIVLLGAGASKAAGVPLAFEMTHELVSGVSGEYIGLKVSDVLNYVTGSVLKQQGDQRRDPRALEKRRWNVERAMLTWLRKGVWLDTDASVDYLKPLSDLARRQGGLVIATLNCDNAVELSAHLEEV